MGLRRRRRTGQGLEGQPALEGHHSATTPPKDVVRLRGTVHVEHTLARLGAEKLWQLLHTEPFVNALGALTGNQAVQQVQAGLKAIYLSRLAGGRRREHGRRDVSRPVPLSRSTACRRGAADQQRAAARRPDAPRRRRRRDRLVRADRRRRRGRLRRRAQRLRADEGHDRGRRGRRALRGPAVLGQEVRPHGRQGAGADAARPSTSWSPRGWRPTCCDVPTVLVARTDAEAANLLTSDVDERDRAFLTGERAPRKASSACSGGLDAGHRPRPGLRALRRPDLVRDRRSPTWTRPSSSPRRSTSSSPASCWPTTARRRSTGRRSSTTPRSPSSSASSARWATSSSSSRWPASTR